MKSQSERVTEAQNVLRQANVELDSAQNDYDDQSQQENLDHQVLAQKKSELKAAKRTSEAC